MSTDPIEAQFLKMLTFMKQPKQAFASTASRFHLFLGLLNISVLRMDERL